MTAWGLGAIDFGGGPLVAAQSDIWVAKLDGAGNHLWSRVLGGGGGQSLTSVAVDAAGSVFVTGLSGGALDLGLGPLQANPAQVVCFLGKLSPSGDPLWGRAYGCHKSQFLPLGPRVAVDASGAAAVTGQFRGTTDFGLGSVFSFGSDAFVFKVDAAGAPIWVKTFSSYGYDWNFDARVGSSGEPGADWAGRGRHGFRRRPADGARADGCLRSEAAAVNRVPPLPLGRRER